MVIADGPAIVEVLKGHRGADTLANISQTAINQKIEWLTVFAFSSENWQLSGKL